MDGDITQVDIEYGPSPSSLHSSLIIPSSLVPVADRISCPACRQCVHFQISQARGDLVNQRFGELQLPVLGRTTLPSRKSSLKVSDEIVSFSLFLSLSLLTTNQRRYVCSCPESNSSARHEQSAPKRHRYYRPNFG